LEDKNKKRKGDIRKAIRAVMTRTTTSMFFVHENRLCVFGMGLLTLSGAPDEVLSTNKGYLQGGIYLKLYW